MNSNFKCVSYLFVNGLLPVNDNRKQQIRYVKTGM